MSDHETMRLLNEANLKLREINNRLDSCLIVDKDTIGKINAFDNLLYSRRIYFIMFKTGLELEFSMLGVREWAMGNAELKVREK